MFLSDPVRFQPDRPDQGYGGTPPRLIGNSARFASTRRFVRSEICVDMIRHRCAQRGQPVTLADQFNILVSQGTYAPSQATVHAALFLYETGS